MQTKVKICGFTRAADIEAAVELGVDFIGLNLAKGPRKISVARAKALRPHIGVLAQAVALFVDASVERVLSDCHDTGCGIAQLHGTESPEEVALLAKRLPVVKALRIRHATDLEQGIAYAQAGASALLLDAFVPGVEGGSGQQWDHTLLADWQPPCPIFLAGGITPGNAAAAASLPQAQVIDVASGVESAPGRKSYDKMAALMAAVQ